MRKTKSKKSSKCLMRKISTPIFIGFFGFLTILAIVYGFIFENFIWAESTDEKELEIWIPAGPGLFVNIMKDYRLTEKVESDAGDKIAVIFWPYSTKGEGAPWDADIYIFDKKTRKPIYMERTEDVSEELVIKVGNKIACLVWEFAKYGEHPYYKVPNRKKWEGSKAYMLDWDGTNKEVVDKNEYYYYDKGKDDIFPKPPYEDNRKKYKQKQ